MNKSYVDELFEKNKIGRIIKYLNDNAQYFSDSDVEHIFNKSFYNNCYYIFYYILELLSLRRKINENIYHDKLYDPLGSKDDFDDIYLVSNCSLEINKYIFNRETKITEEIELYDIIMYGNIVTIKYMMKNHQKHVFYDLFYDLYLLEDILCEMFYIDVTLGKIQNKGMCKSYITIYNSHKNRINFVKDKLNRLNSISKYIYSTKFIMQSDECTIKALGHVAYKYNDIYKDTRSRIHNKRSYLAIKTLEYLKSEQFLNLFNDIF